MIMPMKRHWLPLGIVTLTITAVGILPGWAQENFFIRQERPPRITEGARDSVATEPRPSIEGVIKDVFVHRKPWQMVNPAAPAEFGSGEKKVSKDAVGGTPHQSAGVVVASVEW